MLGTKYEYVPQKGNNLGDARAFAYVFNKEFLNAIALASDIPDLSEEVYHEACATLENSDVVIGPSPDGGYYLIGFKRTTFFPEIFEKIAWSSNTVFQETIERLKKVKRKVHILPLWNDIDTLEDLRGFFKKYYKMSSNSSKTITYLLQHKEILNEMDQSSGNSNCLTNKKYR